MNNSINISLIKGLLLVLAIVVSASAQSAVFAKYEGVEGESKAAASSQVLQPKPAPQQQVKTDNKAQPTSLLLPAVQSNRETAGRADTTKPNSSTKKKAKIEPKWNIEEG